MDNTKLYLDHYANNLSKDLLLFPVKGICVNLSSYLITFNDIIDTSKLKTILEYYAYQQLNAFKIGDVATFDRIRTRMDVIIDSMWSSGKARLVAINNSDKKLTKTGNIHLHEIDTGPTKKLNIFVPHSSNVAKHNVRYGTNINLYDAERVYPNQLDIFTYYDYNKLKRTKVLDTLFFCNNISDVQESFSLGELYTANTIKNTIITNSLQNSSIHKDFNKTALFVFNRYNIRHANLLYALFGTNLANKHNVYLSTLIANDRRLRNSVNFMYTQSDRINHNVKLNTGFKYLSNENKYGEVRNVLIANRVTHYSNMLEYLQMDKNLDIIKDTLQWIESSTSALSFKLDFGIYGDRYSKPVINESAIPVLTNINQSKVVASVNPFVYGTTKPSDSWIVHEMRNIAYKIKITAIDGSYEFGTRLEKMIEKYEDTVSANKTKVVDTLPIEFTDKLKPSKIFDIEFTDKLKPAFIPNMTFGDIQKELTLPDIEFMYKSLNTEVLLFSTLEGKLNQKEASLTGVLLDTVESLVLHNIWLQHGEGVLADIKHNKQFDSELEYVGVTRNPVHPSEIRRTDKKADKYKPTVLPDELFGINKDEQRQLVLHNTEDSGGLRYQKQVQSKDEMFAVTTNPKIGGAISDAFKLGHVNPKVGGAESEPFKLGATHPKEGGAISDPFVLGDTQQKEGGAMSDPFVLGATHPKEGGAMSDPFTIAEKSRTKQGAHQNNHVLADILGKYGTIHGTYSALDVCLKECDSVYKYLTGEHTNKLGISESLYFTWCSINSKSSMIHDGHVKTTRTAKPGEKRGMEFLTTKQRQEAFNLDQRQGMNAEIPDGKVVLNEDPSTTTKPDGKVVLNETLTQQTRVDRDIVLPESLDHTIKDDREIVVPEKTTDFSKTEKNILVDETKQEVPKVDADITIENRRGMTTKQLRDIFLAEQQAKLEKQDSYILVVDDVADLEKLESDVHITSMSYVIEKNPADLKMGDIYLQLKGDSEIYIPLNTTIPMEQAYKTITFLNDIISLDKNFSSLYLHDMKLLYKDKPGIVILEQELNGRPFDKWEKNVILNSSVDIPYIKDDRDILLIDTPIPSDIIKRWYFLPDVGPYDRLVLPLDYPYKEYPIKGVVTGDSDGKSYPFTAKDTRTTATEHPMPNGWDKGIEEIDVSIAIMANVIDYGYVLKDTYKQIYARYTPSQSIKHFVNLFYQWLNDYVPDISYHVPGYVMTDPSNNPEIYRDDYWRLYRWIRWHAEAIIQNLSDAELNVLDGNAHIDLLLNQLIRYFNDHHGIYAKDGKYTLDKVKGVRHRWLSRYNKF